MGAGPRGLRRLAAQRGDGREDPPRLRGRPRPARRVGAAQDLGPATSATASCGASPASSPSAARRSRRSARKLAAVRSFYRHLVERGELEANPADLVSSPRKDAYLPRGAQARRGGGAARARSRRRPARVRDRAMFELAYSAGLRAEELVDLDLDSARPRRRGGARGGQGRQDARVPAGEPAWRRSSATSTAAPALALEAGRQRRALFCRRAAGGCRPPTCRRRAAAAGAPGPSRAASRRTRCATPSPPTCSRAAPTCARSRSCWATPRSARPRHTLG